MLDAARDEHTQLELQRLQLFRVLFNDWLRIECLYGSSLAYDAGLTARQFLSQHLSVDRVGLELRRGL